MIILDLTPDQAKRLQEILEHQFATSVNHLVSSVTAQTQNPTGEWARSAPRLASIVETDRMLKLKLERAVSPTPTIQQADPELEALLDAEDNRTVVVQFEVSMFVTVDLETHKPTRTVVQTPNVSSMSEQLTDCVRYGPDVTGSVHHPARWGRQATEDESATALKILDDNCWPAPELVS